MATSSGFDPRSPRTPGTTSVRKPVRRELMAPVTPEPPRKRRRTDSDADVGADDDIEGAGATDADNNDDLREELAQTQLENAHLKTENARLVLNGTLMHQTIAQLQQINAQLQRTISRFQTVFDYLSSLVIPGNINSVRDQMAAEE